MRILQCISYLYPAWSYGGPGKLVYELSCQLQALGHEVEVYVTDAFDWDRRRVCSDNPFSSRPKLTAFSNLSNALAYRYKAFLAPSVFWALPKRMKQFDAVHIHEIFTPLAAAAARACRQNNVPLFVSAHGTLSGFHLKHRGIEKKLFLRLFENDFRAATGYIAATDEEKKEYEDFGIAPARIHYVPNGINTSEFQNLPPRGRFRAEYQIPNTNYVLLYIGRINHLKGLDMLIEAFSRTRSVSPVMLVIGGTDDGYLATLNARIEQLGLQHDVMFPGILEGDKKLQVFADADIFVYPSPAEGFSLAILEAGAAGLPLVITKGCKFPEVERSGAGKVVDTSAEGLAQGIQSLLEHPKKLKSACAAARRLVQKHYSIRSMGEKLETLYIRG